jgi:predicted metal-dependent enzyme (double-stranded beta helix superfamily)
MEERPFKATREMQQVAELNGGDILEPSWKTGSDLSPFIERKLPRHDFENETKVELSKYLPPTGANSYSPRVHAVIQEARRVFDGTSGAALELLNLAPLREKLAVLRADDVAGERLGMLSKGAVGYVSLEDNPLFTIGVFFLAPGSTIPLHDHPEMCVLSHVMKGMVHVTSFDFDLSSANDVAFLVDDGMYLAPVTRTLYPSSGGNLHSFTTKTGCIIVDVMSPPYDELDGRECTYFQAARIHNQIYKVERIHTPEDFEVLDLS